MSDKRWCGCWIHRGRKIRFVVACQKETRWWSVIWRTISLRRGHMHWTLYWFRFCDYEKFSVDITWCTYMALSQNVSQSVFLSLIYVGHQPCFPFYANFFRLSPKRCHLKEFWHKQLFNENNLRSLTIIHYVRLNIAGIVWLSHRTRCRVIVFNIDGVGGILRSERCVGCRFKDCVRSSDIVRTFGVVVFFYLMQIVWAEECPHIIKHMILATYQLKEVTWLYKTKNRLKRSHALRILSDLAHLCLVLRLLNC